MAIWQCKFYLVPRENFYRHSLESMVSVKERGDDECFWRLQNVERDFFFEFRNILPTEQSWSNSIDLYGNQESTCLEVHFDGKYVVSASFRISFLDNYDEFLNYLIEFCTLKDLIILDENQNRMSLDLAYLIAAIETSPQRQLYKKLTST